MQLDLEELALEYFANGTVKTSTVEDLLRLFYAKKELDDYAGNKTAEHFEEEEEEEEGDARAKRSIFDDDERLP